MQFDVNGRMIETDEQGFLRDPADWSEEFARALAAHDGLELFIDHWELIWYFRDYFEQTLTVPTMRKMVLELGKRPERQAEPVALAVEHGFDLAPVPIDHECLPISRPR